MSSSCNTKHNAILGRIVVYYERWQLNFNRTQLMRIYSQFAAAAGCLDASGHMTPPFVQH